jgi:hypothetical protein
VIINWQAIYDEQCFKDYVDLIARVSGVKLTWGKVVTTRPNHPKFTKHWGV